jgi:PAS domain S-box-containing protein/putative nucleotidyltransferase with HDIG domain
MKDEKALEVSELRYRRLFETAQDGILILDARTGMIADVNPFLIKLLGYSREELVEKKLWQVGAFKDIEASKEAFEALQEKEYIRYENLPLKTKEGRLIQVEFVSNVYLVGDEKVIQCNIRDITEHKRWEESLRLSEERLRVTFAATRIASWDWDIARDVWFGSTQYFTMLGYEPELGATDSSVWMARVFPQDRPIVAEKLRLVMEGQDKSYEYEARMLHADGSYRWHYVLGHVVSRDKAGKAMRMLGVRMDINDRKLTEEKAKRQLEHLKALSAIDRVIASNFDLSLSLSEILGHVTEELRIDAADILILNPDSLMLEYGAGRGFRGSAIRNVRVPLGEGNAGRAAMERRLLVIPDLKGESDNKYLSPFIEGEDFACYFGVPLIAKGQVKGVLGIFHRSAFEPGIEWLDFLNALAGQTAIAIDNATLFESLQRSNLELGRAYDTTIEGWSRALDLRDKETEGHTQRVSEMAVRLARAMGQSEADLVQIRWGALLHDIGKMGVPDGILLKPGPLTDEEWVIMKKHPTFAYEMLSPIHYLRQALEIPFGHHEKWDGSGYPHGLKGVQIPLSARIFAVVDVWDALRSDRPYRSGWSEERVREFIHVSSGSHFDPDVVDAFLRMTL